MKILKIFFDFVDPVIDWQGQYLNMVLMYAIFIVGFMVAFVAGVIMSNLVYTLKIMLATMVVNAVVTLPGWSFYRRNGIKFKKEKKN